MDRWGDYVRFHYPPKHTFDYDNSWAVIPLNYLFYLDLLCGVGAVFCSKKWQWRVTFAALGLASLIFSYVISLGAAMQITNSWL
jgi:hypothetical protein